MFSSFRITTFGWLISCGLLLAVGTAVLLSSVSYLNAQLVEETWTQFDQRSAKKVLLLGKIRSLMGYEGMIHHFKNYILRQERWRVISVHEKMLQLSVAMTAYESLGLDSKEKKAFNVLNETLDIYKKMIAIAETMADAHKTPLEIDAVIQVNDAYAIAGLAVLDRHLAALHRQRTQHVRDAVQNILRFSKISGVVLVTLLLALTMLILWFIHGRLIRPLNRLVEAFSTIDPRDPGRRRLPTNEIKSASELDRLAQTGNTFIEAVHDHSVLRKKAESELREREETLRSVVENAVDAIITIDDKGLITSFNTAAVSMFGYDSHEVLARNVSMLMPEPDQSSYDNYIRNYLETEGIKAVGPGRLMLGKRKDGTTFPLLIGLSKIVTPRGVAFTAIARDLTAEKEAELKLNLAKVEAEEANKAKSQFMASMSHELRTPMNAILGFSEFIKTNPNEPPSKIQAEYLQHVMNSGHQLMGLIDQVLELSNIETDEAVVHMTKVMIFPIVEDCLLSFGSRVEALNVSLENRCRLGDGLTVYTDPVRFRQILLKFISNGVKYNKPNGQVFVEASIQADNITRISVRDTGQGIPKAAQANLFVPFNRLGREAGQIEGTGIGLTITEKIAKTIDAKVGFQSKEGEGSSFWVDLPCLPIGKPQ